MSELNFTQAFAVYGAKPKNVQWSVSALAADGSLVISCWQHKFSVPEKGVMRYTDCLSRWRGNNVSGREELAGHLESARDENRKVRLVIASTRETTRVEEGRDVSGVPKSFHVREDYVGEVVAFDGDSFTIDFKKQTGGPPGSRS